MIGLTELRREIDLGKLTYTKSQELFQARRGATRQALLRFTPPDNGRKISDTNSDANNL